MVPWGALPVITDGIDKKEGQYGGSIGFDDMLQTVIEDQQHGKIDEDLWSDCKIHLQH